MAHRSIKLPLSTGVAGQQCINAPNEIRNADWLCSAGLAKRWQRCQRHCDTAWPFNAGVSKRWIRWSYQGLDLRREDPYRRDHWIEWNTGLHCEYLSWDLYVWRSRHTDGIAEHHGKDSGVVTPAATRGPSGLTWRLAGINWDRSFPWWWHGIQ